MRFRRARLAGGAVLPPALAREVDTVRATRHVDVVEDPDFVNIILPGHPTGPSFNAAATTVLVRVPRAYPEAGPDMFWTDPDLALASGSPPQAADQIELHAGRDWRRFSWHLAGGWKPGLHNLSSYLEFVARRLRAG